MSDKARQSLELRAIEVSTRAALRKNSEPGAIKQIEVVSAELLARLEERVIRDGGEPDLLDAIERARRALWEQD